MAHRAASTRPLTTFATMLVVGFAMLAAATPALADTTAPDITFGTWTESSPYAHYDGTDDVDRLWFNPTFSGSATASIIAKDPETGVKHVTWPQPPTGWSPPGSNDASASDLPGLVASFWDTSSTIYASNFTDAPAVTRLDPNVEVNWGTESPHSSIAPSTFAARWTGRLLAPDTGTYFFQTRSNDGVRVKVNGMEVLRWWNDTGSNHVATQCPTGIDLIAGTKYDIVVEYFENTTNSASMELRWRRPTQASEYRTPTGCDASPASTDNAATGMTGLGLSNYPVIPASQFTVGGGGYSRTFSWTAAAAGGAPFITAENGDSPGDVSSARPIEFVADDQPPVAGGTGTLDIQMPGWGADGSNYLVFPRADMITDAGASAADYTKMTRLVQRRDGSPDGLGGCTTATANWTNVGTPILTATSYSAPIPAAGVCSEFRYLVTDTVGNTLELYASGFRGWDGSLPNVTVTSIAEGINPQYQHVTSASTIFFNGNQSGTFDVTAQPTDAEAGPFRIRFRGQGVNGWLSPATDLDVYDPGPWIGTYEWDPSSASLGDQRIDVWDYASRTSSPITHTITDDPLGPTGGAFTPGDGITWRNTPSVPFDMTTAMSDGTGAGVASYQLQREAVTWTAGACPAFTGVYTNVGAPVYGNPPPPITAVTDTTGITDNACYRYRVEATDNVGNLGYATNTNSVRVDDTDPTVTLDTIPASGSGSITIGGTASDTMSGVASVTVRVEDMSAPGPTTTIYADSTFSATTPTQVWGDFIWDSTPWNGPHRLHIDVIDVAGNVVTSAITHDILLDNSAPTITHTGFAEGNHPEYQHIDPVATNHRAWVKTTGIGTAIPSIFATFLPDDPESGIDFITTPAAPGGTTAWTPATATVVQDPGPYVQQYTWQDGVTSFGQRAATATSGSGKVSAEAPFTITEDNTAPVGGSISPQPIPGPTWHTSLSVALSIVGFVDADAGIATQRIERDEVARNAAGSCNGAPWPLTWSTVVSTPSASLPATVTDTSLVHGMCYRYRIVATDNVGNVASTSITAPHVAVDALAPTATISASSPSSTIMGTVNLIGTSSDGAADGSNSGVAQVTARWKNLDDLTTGTLAADTSAEPAWSIAWNTTSGATPDGTYRIFVDVRDVATNAVTSVATRDFVVDNTPPLVTLDSFAFGSLVDCQYWSGPASRTFWFSVVGAGCGASDFTIRVNATDAPGGVAYVQFPTTSTTGTAIVPDGGDPAIDSTGPNPYEMRYAYTTAADDPGAEIVSATGNSGADTNLDINISRDDTGPTGHTITGPGATTAPAWWSNASAPSISFDMSTATDGGAGVRAAGHRLQRREAPGPDCTTWTGYTSVGGFGVTSPYADASAAEDTCYQYQLVAYDNVNNPGTVTATNRVRIDRTLPSVAGNTINPVPAYVTGTSFTLSGTASDNWSGVASISVRLGAGPATACTPAVAASWSCTWDTTTAPNGPTTLVLVVTDAAGNVLDSQTQPTYVDNEPPTVGVTLAEGTNPAAQHVVSSATPRIYVNTSAGSSGDFTITTTPADGFSGVASVSHPALGTNWTRTPTGGNVASPGPYELTYAWTGGATTADPQGQVVMVTDNASNVSTAPFEVHADTTSPTGATLDYEDGPAATPSITFDEGDDIGGSGVATWRIERREAAVTGPNTCDTGAWSTWTTAVTGPLVSPWTDGTVVLNRCYQYQLVSVDHVGNATIATDATGDTVTIEPAGIVIVESGAGPSTDVTEGGAIDTYTVRLRTRPSADVVITLGPDEQVATNVPTLTFTSANWNIAQTVTVTAVDDALDEVPDPHSGTITHVAASDDSGYATLTGANVVANVTDNDVAAFVVSPAQASVAVTEAGATSDTYTIRLNSQPTANVTVTLGNSDGQVTFAPSSLTFNPANWNVDQTVTITAVDDDYDEVPDAHSGVVTHGVASSDPLYAALTISDTVAAVTDDDAAGVTVAPTIGLTVEEGNPATDQYTVVLDSQPVGSVSINVTDDVDVDVSTSLLVFDSSNWNVPQVVYVSAFQDAIAEGAHTGIVSHTTSAPDPSDAAYASVAVSPVTVDVIDDDVPGIEVTPSSGLTATEGGTGSTYQVRLETEPIAPVTISFATGAQLQPIADVTFTSGDWNTYQTVTVAAVQDDVDEVPDPHTGTIVHTVASTDATYGGWALADQSIAITDDDQAAITVDELGGVTVDEANVAATDTFTVVLESEPVGIVTITPNADAQVTTSAAVTFDDTDWSIPKVITVTAVNDAIDEANPHPGVISLAVTGDPLYAAISPPPVTANVADDDTAGIIVSAGTLALDEDLPAGDSFTVRLRSQPTSPVTITLTTDAQTTAAAPTLTFTPLDWNVDQTVTITPVDDPTVEDDPHPTSVGIAATAGDAPYLAVSPITKLGSVIDNDVPGVTIDVANSVDVTEGTGTDQYAVVLDRQPQADVVVTVVADSQVIGLPSTLTFTTTNWNVAQIVTVTAVDDDIDEGTGTHPGGFTHTVASSDSRWAGVTTAAPVAVAVTDNDVAGVTITSSSPNALDEDTPAPGTTVTYTVELDSQPTTDVVIDLTVPGDLSASPTTLTFTAANWAAPQTVTVGAIDDLVTETPVHTRTITHAITTGDVFYGAVTVAPVAFDVTDNDIPGITVSETTLIATEGGATDTFTVVLETQPAADVTIDLIGTQVGFDVDPLTFTSLTWNTPQTVTVTATDDDIDEHPDTHAGLVEFDVTGDPVYAGWVLADIPVAITDNDVAGVTITPGATAVSVDETGATSATYTVVLDTEPTAPVTITPTVGDGQTTVAPASLSFTAGDWSTPKTFTVTAVDDPDDEPTTHSGTVLHTASSADTHYDATLTIASQSVVITDNDTSSVIVTPTSGLVLDEAVPATTASFDVVLATRPIGNVVISFATSDGQTTVAPGPLTFTPTNWNVPQTVTVSVVNDDIDEAPTHTGMIVVDAASTTDALYAAFDPADVSADIADDDTSAVIITESGGSTDVDEASTSDTYLVRLQTRPTANVTIDITGGSQASTTPVLLTFTPANWNVDQTVTVNGTPDFVVEGPHDQTITHAIVAGDATYVPALAIADVVAHVTDDDVAGATITPTSVDVAEGAPGVTDTYDVVLDAEPAADVTIALTPDSQLLVSTPALVFTPLNWNAPQSVTVTANDDLVVEGSPHGGLITHAMSSPDTIFDGVAVSDVTANITDDDVPGVTINPPNVSVTEGGTGSTFGVTLESVPTADVTVSFTEGGQLVPMASLTFTAANWNTTQNVAVSAFNDFIAEGAHATTITIDTSSSDSYYGPGALTITPVNVAIADDDVAGVLVTPNAGLAGSEGGAPVSYDVSLTSQPVAAVTITLTGDSDGTPVPSTLTFDATNWATPRTVDVSIIQDAIAESAHTTTITHAVSSADPTYATTVTIADQSIAITDDDTASVAFTPLLPGPLAIGEGGPAATYTVALTSEPTGDATIDVASLAGEAVAAPSTLTFTSTNWMTPQTVTVTAVDDLVAELDPHADSLTHTAGGADPAYAALTLGDMDLEITDNDPPGVLIDATLPDTHVIEGGLGDTVRVRLGSEPTADVDVTLSASQVTLGATTLTFTSANWNIPQDVTVDAIQDDIFEGPHVGTIDALTGSVGDPYYAGVAATQHAVTIDDDDTAGVIITQATPNTLDEQAPLAGQTYHVRLQSEPMQPVDVAVTPDAQVEASATTLTFTASTWNVDQAVTVRPIDDALAEPSPHDGRITHDTISADPAYGAGALAIDRADFAIDDNDTPGVTVTPTAPHAVIEGGATSTYTIVLDSPPTANVTIAPVSSQLEWSVPNITFTTTDWNTPQTVTLRAIDDDIDETDPHTGTIVHAVTSADTGYQPVLAADVSADITDNDTSDLVVTPVGTPAVDEAGALPAAQYVLTLTSRPASDVTVTLATPAPAQVAFSAATVTLTSTNWNTGVTVDVFAVQDDVDEPSPHTATITHAMTSADPNFDAETGPDQLVDVADDDTAGVTITPSGASTDVAEDGSAVDDYDVVLESQPIADVTITIATPDGEVAVAPATLTFTSTNWNVAQTVAVSAVQDFVFEGAHTGTITHVASSVGDPSYDPTATAIADVVANVLDDDVPGVIVTPAGGTFEIAEGGPVDQLVVTLATEPKAPVTIDLTTPDGESTVLPTQVVLDAANWNTGVAVDVTAVDDGFIEGTHTADVAFTIDAAASDDDYDLVAIANATAQVSDNDAASAIVDTGDGLSLDEASVGTTDTFSIRLGASPAVGETVDIALGELAPSGQLTFAPTSLTFDDTNWNTPQDITVTVADDAIDETDPHAAAIQFTVTSTDANFSSVTIPDADVTIADDDTAGLVITPATIAVAEAGTTSQVVDVALASEPIGQVEVTVTGDSQVDASGTLTFTPANWSTPQQVTVTARQDLDDELDPHPGIVTFGVSSPASADPTYDALADATRTVDVADDDVSAVNVTLVAGTGVDEATPATTVEYEVVLNSHPSGDVTVTPVPDAQLQVVGPTTLTFTQSDWMNAQTIQVRAADDQVAEASPHPGLLAFAVAGADPRYAALTPAPESLDVLDDDVAGVSVTQGVVPAPLAEDGSLPNATYDVVLTSQPIADVDVTLTPDTQVSVVGASVLTFTAANWSVPQTATVAAVDDFVTESDPHSGVITHASDSTGDANYAAPATLAITDARFEVADDDEPGFTLDPVAPALTVDEAGATSQTYTLSIDSIPAGDVIVNIATTSADVTVSPASHTFNAGNAADPATISVTAVDDSVIDPGETATITHSLDPSSDPGYAAAVPAIVIPDATVDITDDDVAELVVVDGGGVSVAEAGETTGTFTVALSAEPSSDVVIDLAETAGGTPQLDADGAALTPATLTFTATNWNAPQTVTVQPEDDAIVEPDPHATGVSLSIDASASADEFDAVTHPAVPVSIADDDVPAFIVTDSADMSMDEAALTQRTINVRLATVPATPVVLNASGSGQVFSMSPPTALDASNWNTGIDLVFQVNDDAIAEANPHDGTVTINVAPSSDPAYASLAIAPRTFSITDDDLANASITCNPGADWATNGAGSVEMSEDPTAATSDVSCYIQVGTAVAEDVTIAITAAPTSQITANRTSVVIPQGSQNSEEVIFTATDDAIVEGTHAASIEFEVTSVDPIYDAFTIPTVDVEITDDDTVGTIADPAGPIAVTEGGGAETVTLRLTSQPTAPVTIAVDGGAQVDASPATITFLPTTWNDPQSISVRATDDPIDEPDGHAGQVTFTVTAGDAGHLAHTPTPVDVTITDNDTPGVIVAPTGAGNAVGEAGTTDTLDVRLGTLPTDDVTVTLDVGAQLTATPATLTFTAANWNDPQAVTIGAVQDPIVEGDHTGTITFAIGSNDPAYVAGSASTPPSQPVTITDDDLPGITIVETDAATSVTEAGGTDTYTIALLGQPTADVTIAIDGGTQVTTAPASLTFTAANWDAPQVVTVTAVQDDVDEPDPHTGQITHVATTTAAAWTGAKIAGVAARIADDDEANIVAVQTGGRTAVVEGREAGDTITFALSSQPTSDVSILAKGDTQVSVTDKPIVLTPAKWKDPITLKVNAIDDEEVEGDHEGAITFTVSSDDAGYRKASTPAVTVAIGDNDVDELRPNTTTEEDEHDDGETGTRGPRLTVPPATTRQPDGDSDLDARRTSDGATRTDAGSTRTPDGVEGASTTGTKNPDGMQTGRRLGGEVTAAMEEETVPVRRTPMARMADWFQENWSLAALIVGGGTIVAGTGAWLLRGDPIKAAQRAANAKGAADAARRGASKGSSHVRPRRVGNKKKKRVDDEDDDGPAPGARRRR